MTSILNLCSELGGTRLNTIQGVVKLKQCLLRMRLCNLSCTDVKQVAIRCYRGCRLWKYSSSMTLNYIIPKIKNFTKIISWKFLSVHPNRKVCFEEKRESENKEIKLNYIKNFWFGIHCRVKIIMNLQMQLFW